MQLVPSSFLSTDDVHLIRLRVHLLRGARDDLRPRRRPSLLLRGATPDLDRGTPRAALAHRVARAGLGPPDVGGGLGRRKKEETAAGGGEEGRNRLPAGKKGEGGRNGFLASLYPRPPRAHPAVRPAGSDHAYLMQLPPPRFCRRKFLVF